MIRGVGVEVKPPRATETRRNTRPTDVFLSTSTEVPTAQIGEATICWIVHHTRKRLPLFLRKASGPGDDRRDPGCAFRSSITLLAMQSSSIVAVIPARLGSTRLSR